MVNHNKEQEKGAKTYANLKFQTVHGIPYDIPVGGSLGLLALGYIGLMAWREKRMLETTLPPGKNHQKNHST